MTKATLSLICLLCLVAACAPPPSDMIDNGPFPAEPIQEVLVYYNGDLKINTIATASTDLRVQFTPNVQIKGKHDFKPVATIAELEAALVALREQRPLSSVVILLTDRPIAANGAKKNVPRHGVASPKLRAIIASQNGISFVDDNEETDNGSDTFSRMVTHLFGHVAGLPHNLNSRCIMFDWRDDIKMLEKNADAFCGESLTVLDPILRSKEVEYKELILEKKVQ